MMPDEQIAKIKEQLLSQLENFPEDKRDLIKSKIESMSTEEVEEFVKQNELNHLEEDNCIFCKIVKGEIPSYKIEEDAENLAVLEINPASKGHMIVIQKNHEIPSKNILEFSKKVSEKLKKLNPKKISIGEKSIMNHQIVDIIPIFESTNLNERKKATEEELSEIQKELLKKDSVEEKIQKEEMPEEKQEITKLKQRLP